MTILRIDSSARTQGSTTRALADEVETALAGGEITRRDLAADPLPQISGDWVAARLVPEDQLTDADRAILALSDRLVAELQEADTIVITAPIYNFGLPAALKAWIDLVARPKLTFSYTADGPVGHLTGKRAIIVAASGGVQIGAPGDFATPHLRHVLGFLGISDVTVVTSGEDIAALTPAQAA